MTDTKKIFIEIDPNAGFCFGVTNSIKKTEEFLEKREEIYVLGELVHNEEELKRLMKIGMKVISHDEIDLLKGKEIIIRAHGEPPSTYKKLKQINAKIYDLTCPIVLQLQKKISIVADEMIKTGGMIVIYGVKNHPEVIGLMGHTKGIGVVVEDLEQAKELQLNRPVALFSQTTKDKEGFDAIENYLKYELNSRHIPFESYATMCKIVDRRLPSIESFSRKHDMIIFVSGKESSNGQYLFRIAKNNNSNAIFISFLDEIEQLEISSQVESIGISGATSTPQSLLELVKERLEKKING
jgi:(E)-4-hydroxy-3-methyl-but-2-enyl pyrophosphate reductase